MKRIRCRIRTIWGTVTMPEFWRALVTSGHTLVVFSGHVWPWPPVYGEPVPSHHPDDWPGLVQIDESRCEECGYREDPPWWRAFYGRSQ